MELELLMDIAWDMDKIGPTTLNQHLEHWLCTQFGEEVGKQLFPVMHEFYRLCNIRRPEFMGYTQVELDKRLYERGLSKVDSVPISASEAASRLAAFRQSSPQLQNANA